LKSIDDDHSGIENSLELKVSDVLPLIQNRIMTATFYCGIKTLKNPIDFWVYQEIIYAQKPDVIIEIGNNWGGSTLALAHYLDNIGHGRIIGIDIDHHRVVDKVRLHPRISWIEDDAISAFEQVQKQINEGERVLVIEDSAHTFENTLVVLETYSPLIPIGGYFIVEDSICHHGLDVGPSPGPYEAITEFVAKRSDFVVDRSKESFLITWNPKGFLLKC
jgi:cephalosporin hydroxylase